MGYISAQPVIVGDFPTGTLQPQPVSPTSNPNGGSTLVMDATTGAVASVKNGVLGEAPKGSASPNELCWVEGPYLVFRPTNGPSCYFLYRP